MADDATTTIDFFDRSECIQTLDRLGFWEVLDERPTGAHVVYLKEQLSDSDAMSKKVLVNMQYTPAHTPAPQFIAVDKGVMPTGAYEGIRQCEGLICSDCHLYFVELKDQHRGARGRAKQQLKGTIFLFQRSHPDLWETHTKRKAYVCNTRFPGFHQLDTEERSTWYRETKTRIDATTIIQIP